MYQLLSPQMHVTTRKMISCARLGLSLSSSKMVSGTSLTSVAVGSWKKSEALLRCSKCGSPDITSVVTGSKESYLIWVYPYLILTHNTNFTTTSHVLCWACFWRWHISLRHLCLCPRRSWRSIGIFLYLLGPNLLIFIFSSGQWILLLFLQFDWQSNDLQWTSSELIGYVMNLYMQELRKRHKKMWLWRLK